MKLKGMLKVLLLVIGLLELTSCVNKSNNSVPCGLLKCTDFSCEDDAYTNGVLKEICGKDCIVE